jgi:uncharacterized membrane protein YccC
MPESGTTATIAASLTAPRISPIRALWRALIVFEPQKMIPEIAFRNTLGFLCAFVLGTVLSSPSTGAVAGLGALNVCYSDGVDPYALRARRMLLSTLLVFPAVVLGALSGHSNIAAVCLAAAWAFAAGMLVAAGTTAADLGVITLVTVVIFAAKPLLPIDALETGAVATAGGLLQTIFSTFLWPLRRYQPERRILANIYSELAGITRRPPSAAQMPAMTAQISDAQDFLAPLSRDHTWEAERHVFLLTQAERIRLSVLNAGRLQRRIRRHPSGSDAASVLDGLLGHASEAIRLIGLQILAGKTPESIDKAIEEISDDLVLFQTVNAPEGDTFFAALLNDARRQCATLRTQIRSAAAASAVNAQGLPAEFLPAAAPERLPWRLRFEGHRARLMANLSLDSTVLRHALRLAGCLSIGDIIGRSLTLQRTYWIPMTVAIVLKPDFTSTFARGVLRVGGTLTGLVLATLLFRSVHTGLTADIVLMGVFLLLLRWVGPANYGIFVVAMSSIVVLLISVTGIPPEQVIAARALNTALGGALALLAYAVWPTWEKTQTRAALVNMLDAYREYTQAVFGAWQGAGTASIDRVRLKGRRARSNAQASVDRAIGEPGVTAKQAASLNAILVHSHSFVHAVMAMESRLYARRRDSTPDWLPAFAASVDRALVILAGVLKDNGRPDARPSRLEIAAPPSGSGGNELLETEADRIRASLRSLGEELAKPNWL